MRRTVIPNFTSRGPVEIPPSISDRSPPAQPPPVAARSFTYNIPQPLPPYVTRPAVTQAAQPAPQVEVISNPQSSTFSPNVETFASIGNSYFITDANINAEIATWSAFPATQNVNMDGFNLNSTGAVAATSGSFSGAVTAAGVTATNGTFSGPVSATTLTSKSTTLTNTGITPGRVFMFDNNGLSHTLQSVDANLFFDNELLAKAGDIQNITDWSLYPALQAVDMQGFNLENVKEILTDTGSFGTAGQVLASDGSKIEWITPPPPGDVATWSTFPATSAVTMNGNSLLEVSEITTTAGSFGTVGQVLASDGSKVQWITPTGGDPATWATYAANDSVKLAGNPITDNSVTVTATQSSATFADVDITAQSGIGGRINLNANPGLAGISGGSINLTANGGSSPAGLNGAVTITANPGTANVLGTDVVTGGSVNIVANSGLALANASSKISLTAGGINSYAGVSSPIGSVFGYNFLQGSLGVSLVAGSVTTGFQVPGTVYLYGATGINLNSDVYTNDIYPYWDGSTPPSNLTIHGRTTILGSASVNLDNVDTINMEGSGAITGVSTINGAAYPPAAGVTTLNTLSGAVTLAPGTNISLVPVGNTITINQINDAVKQATYYKTVTQDLSSGNTDITFDAVGAWNNDGGYITHVSGTTSFTVVQAGLYQLEFNAIVLVNNGVWSTTTNRTINIDITRTPTAELAIITSSAVTAASLNYGQSVSGTYYLVAGDVINLRLGNTYTGGTPTPPQASGITNSFDLNTFFTWSFISSGGATAYQNPPPVIQAAGTTALIPTSANTTYILTSGSTQNFTTAGLGAGNAGLVWYVKNARGTDITIRHNGTNITGQTSTIHQNTGSTNSSIQILYWNGTDLIMY